MANFITEGQDFSGKHSEQIIFRPIFTGEAVESYGFRVMLVKESALTLTLWKPLLNRLRKYSSGFSGGTGSSRQGKRFTLEQFKLETSWEKHDYYDLVLQPLVNAGGAKQNDISGTMIMAAEQKLLQETIKHDVFVNTFLGYKNAYTYVGNANADFDYTQADATFDSDGVLLTGGYDVRINTADGIFFALENNVKNESNADDVIGQTTIANNGTSKVVNVSGVTGGVALTFSINGTVFAATTATGCTGWVADNEDKFALAGGGSLEFEVISATEMNITGAKGIDFTIDTLSTGAAATTTAVVVASALATDQAEQVFSDMWNGARKEVRLAKKDLVYLVTEELFLNYQQTMSRNGLAMLESMRSQTINGGDVMRYNGIPVRIMHIDLEIDSMHGGYCPNRAILTEVKNITLVVNGRIGESRIWFNVDENENRQRCMFEMKADIMEPIIIQYAS